MQMSEAPRPDPTVLSDADIEALIPKKGAARSVNMLHPMEIFVERESVGALIRHSLRLMQAGVHRSDDESAEQALAYDMAMQQRVDFLAWLQSQPDLVYLAIYPADQDGLDELELEEIADSSTDDTIDPEEPLPF